MSNFSHICLTEPQLQMSGTRLEYNLQRYFYPALAIFGILGNVLNLTVLLNKSMRSRANSFLAVLAFSDIIFLFLLFPNILANYSIFTFNYYFRWFYLHSKVHLISLANWCSSVAHWCVIAVCADRLFGIRNPLYARATWRWWKLPLVTAIIVFFCGILTFYQHFEYFCLVREYCSATQLYSRCLPVNADKWFGGRPNPFSIRYQKLIQVCKLLHIFLMIILPIILLLFLNLTLLCALRKRQKHLSMGKECTDRCHNESYMQKTEHRVTLTVTFIVTMFTLTNGPSALVHLVMYFTHRELYDLTMISSTLVICGKASNFILFCLGSKHFRLRLLKLTQKKINRKIESIAGSFVANTKLSTVSSPRPSFQNNECVPSICKQMVKSRALSATETAYKPLLPPKPARRCS
ncbi:unnamed protein product [Caenorhabditis bovis]|uniref:G-protein coupled receptors family 1 profile domain-containing protein n=1 Tax=Caenorhabditis bovis TaxID=2654633 RepID=A0A8S1E9P3_9PELO|nr:unnamed protein product [Caenorhabditis bovis]